MQLLEIALAQSAATEDTRPFQRVGIVRRKPVDWNECERRGYRKIGQTIEGFPRFVSDHVHDDARTIHS
jgi:hypothetical protein